jgi:hypothetical protein
MKKLSYFLAADWPEGGEVMKALYVLAFFFYTSSYGSSYQDKIDLEGAKRRCASMLNDPYVGQNHNVVIDCAKVWTGWIKIRPSPECCAPIDQEKPTLFVTYSTIYMNGREEIPYAKSKQGGCDDYGKAEYRVSVRNEVACTQLQSFQYEDLVRWCEQKIQKEILADPDIVITEMTGEGRTICTNDPASIYGKAAIPLR